MNPGDPVELRSQFDDSWAEGFEIAERAPEGYRVRRLSDGSLLPGFTSGEDLRPHRPAGLEEVGNETEGRPPVQDHETGDAEAGQDADSAADDREHLADEREAALDDRENRTAAHEAGFSARIEKAKIVLADAQGRDDRADARDSVADERERTASLEAFLHPDADAHDAAVKARRASAVDRSDAKSDRSSSAEDRSKLSDG